MYLTSDLKTVLLMSQTKIDTYVCITVLPIIRVDRSQIFQRIKVRGALKQRAIAKRNFLNNDVLSSIQMNLHEKMPTSHIIPNARHSQ